MPNIDKYDEFFENTFPRLFKWGFYAPFIFAGCSLLLTTIVVVTLVYLAVKNWG